MSERNRVERVLEWAHHVYWIADLLISLGIGKGLANLMTRFFVIPSEWQTAIWLTLSGLLCLGLMLIIDLMKRGKGKQEDRAWADTASSSFLKSQSPELANFQDFMRRVHIGGLQTEAEGNIAKWMNAIPQKEKDSTLRRFIASGIIAYMHDMAWWAIFRSQIEALEALNHAPMRKEDIKRDFYDKAAQKHPQFYETYTFEQWLEFLKAKVLVLDLHGNVVGITDRGKDFLKHMIHYGYSPQKRTL